MGGGARLPLEVGALLSEETSPGPSPRAPWSHVVSRDPPRRRRPHPRAPRPPRSTFLPPWEQCWLQARTWLCPGPLPPAHAQPPAHQETVILVPHEDQAQPGHHLQEAATLLDEDPGLAEGQLNSAEREPS